MSLRVALVSRDRFSVPRGVGLESRRESVAVADAGRGDHWNDLQDVFTRYEGGTSFSLGGGFVSNRRAAKRCGVFRLADCASTRARVSR